MDWSEWLAAAASVILTSVFAWKWLKKSESAETSLQTEKKHAVVPETVTEQSPESDVTENDPKKVSYVNNGFQDNDPISTPPVVAAPRVNERGDDSQQQRNISDVSVVFRPPSPDEKTLSDIVIGKFDRKSKKLRSVRLHDAVESDASSITAEPIEENDELDTPAENIVSSRIGIDVTDGLEQADKSQVNKSTEWRDKLKLDLDDEEFDDDLSDEDDEDVDDDDFDDLEIEERLKTSSSANRTLSSLSSMSCANKLFHERPLVIDNGSYLVRGGWAGEFAPTAFVRNVTGSWRTDSSEAWHESMGSKFIGEAAIHKHSSLALEYPIEDGKITKWKELVDVLQHLVVKEMEADFSQHPVIITEPAKVDLKQREKMVEVLIESIRTPGVCLRSQSAMCLLSTDKNAGVVINCGYSATEVVPVYCGYSLPYATTLLDVGGRHITDYLSRLTHTENGLSFTSVPELEILNSIKEQYATVAPFAGDQKVSTNPATEYTMPDGRIIKLGNELSNCTEAIFKPGLVGKSSFGLPTLVKQSVDRVDSDFINESHNVILLTGGGSRLNGLKERLEAEINSKMDGLQLSIQRSISGDNAAWVGASLLAEQSGFSDLCITEDTYFEQGANVVHRLCF